MSSGVMSDKRLLLAKLAEARDTERGGPKRRALARTAAVLVILAVLVALAVWFSGFFSTPKEVLEIRAMVNEQIGQLQKVARNEAPLTYDTSNFRQNWERMRDMTPAVREKMRDEMERLFRAREQAELRSYFAMPAQERQKELDRRIKAEEDRRQAWRQQRTNQAGGNGPNGGPNGGPGQGQGRGPGQGGPGGQTANARDAQGRGGAAAGSAQAIAGGPRGGGGPGGGGPGGGAPGGSAPGGGPRSGRGTEDGRNTRSKQRIDSTSPEERAQSTEYRRAMDARRQQLGLSSGRGRGG